MAINRYHAAAVVYFVVSAAAGAAISGGVSPKLQASGWHILHAYIALMGFGTLMILGNQRALVPVAMLIRMPGRKFEYKRAGVFTSLNAALWLIWAAFLLKRLTGGVLYNYVAVVCGFAVMVCLAVFAQRLYGDIGLRDLWRNLPIRYFVTSLFMCFLAYWQMAHIMANDIRPFLPFSETLSLRHNYLALSIPISLSIMGAMNLPFYEADRGRKSGSGKLWEFQYGILVFGVFALFFALLFDNPASRGIFDAMKLIFSSVLVLSIVVFAVAVLKSGPKPANLPAAVKRYYVCAIFWLAMAGAAGLLLGYGWGFRSPMFYFLIQSHIHLALLGWVGMGLAGNVYYIFSLSGRSEEAGSLAQFLLMNAGIVVFCVGIYHRSMALKSAGGGLVAASFLILLYAVLARMKWSLR